jgi:aspartate/methionine/tyrosine aminotransferase
MSGTVGVASRFRAFELEHWQSDWEHRVEINLADSGVAPMQLRDLLSDAPDAGDVTLHYPEVNGNVRLRERIAALYSGADADNVLVTVGGSEANALVVDTLLAAGDHVAGMVPGYLQVQGLAMNRGCVVSPLVLDADRAWNLDHTSIDSSMSDRTRLVSITTPNNPTGATLSETDIAALVDACTRSGAWLHVDEVYRGSELDGREAPSLWGTTPRTVIVGSLSKSYGLPGLRIGWIVAPRELIPGLWRRHEYATISAASVSMYLAELALCEPRRTRLLERQRGLARAGLEILQAWVGDNADIVSLVTPRATALAFVRYHLDLPSVTVAEQIRDRANVLVAPGAYLGAEHHLRVAHALNPARTAEALERISTVLRGLR